MDSAEILKPQERHFAITAGSDVATATSGAYKVCRAIYVGTGGNLNLNDKFGSTVLYKNVQSGTTLVGQFSAVVSASTTATDLVALV